MSAQAKLAATALLWFQVVCAVIFAATQAVRMFYSTEGVSMSFFACHGLYALLLLALSVAACKNADPDTIRIKRQSVYIYGMWASFIGIHIGIALWKMPKWWNGNDNTTVGIVAVGLLATLAVGRASGLSLIPPDAYVKAGFATFLKCVPQLTLAISIYEYGQGGLSGWWIFMGHVTIVTQIVHLGLSNREGWDSNTKASFWSEVGNETSWLVATWAWLYF